LSVTYTGCTLNEVERRYSVNENKLPVKEYEETDISGYTCMGG
jgi:hypothetical protein